MRFIKAQIRLTAWAVAVLVFAAACGGSSEPRSLSYSCPEELEVAETAAVLATISGSGEAPAFHWVQESADGGAITLDTEQARFRANPIGAEDPAISRREITGIEAGAVTLRVNGDSTEARSILDAVTSEVGCQVAVG